jgi:DNA-binding YbaB/EbfC family protein
MGLAFGQQLLFGVRLTIAAQLSKGIIYIMAKFPNPGNIGALFQQAQKALADAKVAEEELSKATVEGVSPGGHVKVVCSGTCQILSVKIAKDAVDPDDVETLEDLVTAAVREAVDKANKMREERLKSSRPAGMGGLF